MKKIILLLGVFMISFISDKPDEKNAKIEVSKLVKEWSLGKVELTDLKKTDGKEKDVFGVKTYQLNFDAKLKYLEDGYVSNNYATRANSKVIGKSLLNLNQGAISENLRRFYFVVKKEQILDVKGFLVFEKSEKGWKNKEFLTKIYIDK